MATDNGQRQPSPVIIIKMGGSSITDKASYETLKQGGVQQAASIVAACTEAGVKCIIVHGAGSFGHPQAKKYAVNGGWSQYSRHTSEEDRQAFENVRYGFAATRCSVLKLSHIIMEELVRRGLPATTLPPCGTWDTKAGAVTKSNPGMIASLLDLGFIPIIHGDVVLDEAKGCNILSGDTIIRSLAKDVPGVKRVIFLTDVDGVFDKAPSLPGAHLLSRIEVGPDGNIARAVTTEDCGMKDDVTGGMKLKLHTAIQIQVDSEGRIPVFVCDVMKEAALRACLKGEVGKDATMLCAATS